MRSGTKTWYVDRVRELLRSELPDDDLDLLSSDLQEQLSDVGHSDVESRLGSPEEFVEAYRSSAGLEIHLGSSRSQLAVIVERWLDERRLSALGRFWSEYQLGWWLLRGWVMLIAFAVVSAGPPTFRPFPIPHIDDRFWTTSLMVLVAFTAASVLLARTTKWLPGRIVNILVSAFAAYVAFVGAVNT